MLKVVILAMFFEGDITFVITELKAKASLREFTGVYDVPDAKEVYMLLSRCTVDQFADMALRTVNAVCGKRKIGKTIIIGYTTNLTVDINWFRKKYNSEDLKDKDYKWAYSRSRGYYIGMKLVLAIEYHSLKPLAFRFTLSSVIKISSPGVVLVGIAISLGFRDKGSLQRLAEW